MASVPPWKQALLEKKRRQEDDDRRRFEQEQKRLAQMPSWKRELLLKKKKISDSVGGEKNMVIIESSKPTEGVNGRSYYPEFSGSQRTTPDSGFDESEDAAAHRPDRAGHPAYIQESRWVQVNAAKGNHAHIQRNAPHDIPDGVPVENGVAPAAGGRAGHDSDEELPYQPGFVHKLLDKFSHMTVNERARRISQGGTEYSDDSGGSAKSSPRYESDHKQHPSRNLYGSNENLLQEKQMHHISSEDKVVHKDNTASREKRTVATIEKIENIPGEGRVVIVSSSLPPSEGAKIPNGTVPTDSIDGKVTVSYGRGNDEKVEEPLVKNIVSSVRNIFEGGKRRAAPQVPKAAASVRQSQPVPNHTPVAHVNDAPVNDNINIVPSQAKPVNSSVSAQSQPEVVAVKTKPSKKGTPDVDAIKKIRDAGQSWFFGKDEQESEQKDNGATVTSSGYSPLGSPEMVPVVKKKEPSGTTMVDIGRKRDPVPIVQETEAIEPVIKEKTKAEPPKNIEIKPKAKKSSKSEKKRAKEPPKMVEVKSKSTFRDSAPTTSPAFSSSSSSSSVTMVEVKSKNKSKGSVIINPTALPRKRHAPAVPVPVPVPVAPVIHRSSARAPPRENNNEPKQFVKVEDVTTDQTDVDSGKIIITDTEDDDNIPVTNIDDMLFDDDDDEIDIVDVSKSRKVAPPSGIDTHLDLSSIVNEEPEVKTTPIPSPVRPCNISFVGEGVKLDKNLLLRTRSKDGRNIRFKESTPEVFEYPSELTMMSFFPEEEQDNHIPTSINNYSDSDSEDDEREQKVGIDTTDNMMSSPNSAVGTPGSALGSYKHRFVNDYQLGNAPTPSGRPLAQRIIKEPEPEPEEMQIKPADEDETYAWSETTNSDMLF